MTQLGLSYLQHAETKRANQANEAETHRSNTARETETNRHNVVTEGLSEREIAEKERSNRANEDYHLKDLAERGRHNLIDEANDSRRLDISEDQFAKEQQLKTDQFNTEMDYKTAQQVLNYFLDMNKQDVMGKYKAGAYNVDPTEALNYLMNGRSVESPSASGSGATESGTSSGTHIGSGYGNTPVTIADSNQGGDNAAIDTPVSTSQSTGSKILNIGGSVVGSAAAGLGAAAARAIAQKIAQNINNRKASGGVKTTTPGTVNESADIPVPKAAGGTSGDYVTYGHIPAGGEDTYRDIWTSLQNRGQDSNSETYYSLNARSDMRDLAKEEKRSKGGGLLYSDLQYDGAAPIPKSTKKR